MTTEPTGPANNENDPLGPSAPQPEPTGEPRTPGSAPHSADNIRADQGTHAAGTVLPAPDSDAGSDAGSDSGSGNDAEDAFANAADDAAKQAPAAPSSADGGGNV